MLKKHLILFVFAVFVQFIGFAQSNFYDVDSLREIRIYFYDTDWDYQLDSFYVQGDNERILADLIIDGSPYDSVGVRYKGFSSVSVNRVKNPFNIKLDYVIDGQDHNGVDKLKLSNVIQDPSFVREVLTYEIAANYLPSAKANYANVYVNDTLWGLYTNVEAVNKDFLNDHFGNKYNPFFKCNPENLDVTPGGENSNLSNAHGNDSLDYEPYYALKSNYGWESLYNLIDTLNNYSDSVEKILNVDRTLWMHALNYTLVNFDSYIGYGQNYYLYKDKTGQFNPLLWDLNMSFGSFRLTDASSIYFSGFDTFNNVTIEGTLTFDGDIDINSDLTISGNLYLPDNSKAIFGDGSDLQIYHDGSGSYIDDQGTGPIRIRSGVGGALRFQDLDGDDLINATSNGAVTLYYDNSAKLATTATGIDVTGNATFGDNGKAIFGAGSDLQIYHDGNDSRIDEVGGNSLFYAAVMIFVWISIQAKTWACSMLMVLLIFITMQLRNLKPPPQELMSRAASRRMGYCRQYFCRLLSSLYNLIRYW